MLRTNFQDLLDAGVHFGHMKRKWNPKMAPYIFMEKNGIHIIDLHKTAVKIDEAANVMKQLAYAGRRILFVATKKQAKDIVAEYAESVGMPYVTERWPGGMLTNFPTIRKAVKKMHTIDEMKTNGTFETLAKRERLQIDRQRAKLEKNLGSIADLNRLPAALFVVDIQKEMNAVREANRLNIPVIAIVDTCCDPTPIDYVIPGNDDAAKSVSLILNVLCSAIKEGLEERKLEKGKEEEEQKETKETEAPIGKKIRPRKNVRKAEAKPAKPENEMKTETDAEVKEEVKVKKEVKEEAKVEVKAEADAEEAKAEVKAEAKEDVKVEAKEEAKVVEKKETAKPKEKKETKEAKPKAESEKKEVKKEIAKPKVKKETEEVKAEVKEVKEVKEEPAAAAEEKNND